MFTNLSSLSGLSSSSRVRHFARLTFFTITYFLVSSVLISSSSLYGFLEYDPIIKKKIPIYPIKPVCSLLVKESSANSSEAKIVCNVGGDPKNTPNNPSYLSLTLPGPVAPLKNSELFTIIGRTLFILLGKNDLYQTEFKEWPTIPNTLSKVTLPPLKKIVSIPEAQQIAMIAEKKQLCLGYRKRAGTTPTTVTTPTVSTPAPSATPSTSTDLYVSCFDLPLSETLAANININSIEKKLSSSITPGTTTPTTPTAPAPIIDYASNSSGPSGTAATPSNSLITEFTNALVTEKTEMDISQKILMRFKMASTLISPTPLSDHKVIGSSPIQELCAGIGQMAQAESECCPYLALNNNSICAYPPAAFITQYFSDKDHLATLFDYKDPEINLDPQTCKKVSAITQEENPETNYELLMGRSDVLFQNYAYGVTSYGQLSSAGLNKELKNFALINTINTRIRTHLFRLRMMRLLQTMQSKFHQDSQEGVASLYSTIFSSMLLSYYFHQQSAFYRMLWGHYRYSPSKLLPLPHRESVNCYYWPFCWRAKETSFGGNLGGGLSDMNFINSWNIPKNAPRNRVWPHWLATTAGSEVPLSTPTATTTAIPLIAPMLTPTPTPPLPDKNDYANSIALVDAPISRFDAIGGSPVGFYGRNVNWYDENINNFDYRTQSPFWMTIYNQDSTDSDLDEIGEYFFNQLHAAFPPEERIASNPFIWPHRNLERKEAFLTAFLLDNIINVHGINNLEDQYRLQAQCYKNLYQMQIGGEGSLKQQVFIQTMDKLFASAYANVGDTMNSTDLKTDLKINPRDENSYLIEGETAQTLKADKTAAVKFVWSSLEDLLKGEENSELKNQLKKENLISEEFAFPKFDDATEKNYRQNIERMIAEQKEEVNSFSRSAVFKTSQERYKKMSQELMVHLKKSLEKQKTVQALQAKGKGNKADKDFLLASLTAPDSVIQVPVPVSAPTSMSPSTPPAPTTISTTTTTPVVKNNVSPIITSGLKQMMERGVYQDIDLKSYSSSDIFSYHSMVYRSFALKTLWQGIGQ